MESREPLRNQLVHAAIQIVKSHGNVMKIAALGAELTALWGASKYREGLAQAGNKHSVKRALELASPRNTWRFDGHYVRFVGKSAPSTPRRAVASEATAASSALGGAADYSRASTHHTDRAPSPSVVSLLKVVANSLRRVSQTGLDRGYPVSKLYDDAVRSLGRDLVEHAIRSTSTTSFSDAIVASAPGWITVCVDKPDHLRLRDLSAIPAFVDEPSGLGGGFGGPGADIAAASSLWSRTEDVYAGDASRSSASVSTRTRESAIESESDSIRPPQSRSDPQAVNRGTSDTELSLERLALGSLLDSPQLRPDEGDALTIGFPGLGDAATGPNMHIPAAAAASSRGSAREPSYLSPTSEAGSWTRTAAASAAPAEPPRGDSHILPPHPRNSNVVVPRVSGHGSPNHSRLALMVVIHRELVDAPDHIVQMSVLGPLMRAAIRGDAWTELMQSERVKKTTDLIRNLCGRFTDFTFGRMTSGSAELASDPVRLDKFADEMEAMDTKLRSEAAAAGPAAAAAGAGRPPRPRGARTVTKIEDLDLPASLKWSRYATPDEVLVMSVCYRLILDTPATQAGLHCSDIGDLGNRAIVLLGRERYMKGTANQKLGELLGSKGKENILLLPRSGKPGVMDAVLRTSKVDELVSSGAYGKGETGTSSGNLTTSHPRIVQGPEPTHTAHVPPPLLPVAASGSGSGHLAPLPETSSSTPPLPQGPPGLGVSGHTHEGVAGLHLRTSAPMPSAPPTGPPTPERGVAPAAAATTAAATSSDDDYERCREFRLVLRHAAPGSWTPYSRVVKRIGSMALAKPGESDLLHLLLHEGSVEFRTTAEGLMVKLARN